MNRSWISKIGWRRERTSQGLTVLSVVPNHPYQRSLFLLIQLWDPTERGADVLGDAEEDDARELHQGRCRVMRRRIEGECARTVSVGK
jgi:hypothetical protein